VAAGEPLDQKQEHCRGHAGLRDTENHPNDVQMFRDLDQRAGPDHQASGSHNAGNPSPGPYLVRQFVTGNFEKDQPDEDQAAGQAERDVGQANVNGHVFFDHTDVDPIDVGQEVAKDDDRDKPEGDLRTVERSTEDSRVLWVAIVTSKESADSRNTATGGNSRLDAQMGLYFQLSVTAHRRDGQHQHLWRPVI